MSGRLSALQKNIICAIAKHTLDVYALHDMGTYVAGDWLTSGEFITYNYLFSALYPDYQNEGRKKYLSRMATFSRSIRDLIKKKRLVNALALAWILHSEGHEDLLCWQGGGRKKVHKTDDYTFKNDTPRYRMFSLTDDGWKVARDMLGANAGLEVEP